jgi:hypothetical protein
LSFCAKHRIPAFRLVARDPPWDYPYLLNQRISSLAIFDPRRRSIARGTLLVLGSFAAAFPLSGFPHSHATLLLIVPALLALIGTFDHIRCMQPRWNLYHGGVILLIYMDLMAICLILFFLLFPYLL